MFSKANLGAFATVLALALSAQAEQLQKLECWFSEPVCQQALKFDPEDVDFTANGISSLDSVVKANASLVFSDAEHFSSVLKVELVDAQTGKSSSQRAYTISGQNASLSGGFSDFIASNGASYSFMCTGSHLKRGDSVSVRPSKCVDTSEGQ
ncbi:MAG: hypothetical protein EOP06_00025 [Proteobacteria bacterium]|nr:MAG: hypothetical protein EOP06_00025 [Pseudomonadota bacterium]